MDGQDIAERSFAKPDHGSAIDILPQGSVTTTDEGIPVLGVDLGHGLAGGLIYAIDSHIAFVAGVAADLGNTIIVEHALHHGNHLAAEFPVEKNIERKIAEGKSVVPTYLVTRVGVAYIGKTIERAATLLGEVVTVAIRVEDQPALCVFEQGLYIDIAILPAFGHIGIIVAVTRREIYEIDAGFGVDVDDLVDVPGEVDGGRPVKELLLDQVVSQGNLEAFVLDVTGIDITRAVARSGRRNDTDVLVIRIGLVQRDRSGEVIAKEACVDTGFPGFGLFRFEIGGCRAIEHGVGP